MSTPLPNDDNIVELSSHKPHASVVMIDPATARRWLGYNEANRTVRRTQVAKFANDMRHGRWQLTGAPVQFATDGSLLDGQHRLHAVVDADVTVPMFVVRNLPPEAQAFMDTGSKRQLGDQLTIAGYRNSSTLGSGARLAYRWLTNQLNQPGAAISDPEVRSFIEANPTLGDAADYAAKLRRSSMDVHPSALCAATWMLREQGHDWESIEEFFGSMAENRTKGSGDPRNALLQRLTRARQQRERIESANMLSLVIRTYNAWYLDRSLQRLPVHVRGDAIDVPAMVKPLGWTR